MPPFSLSPFHSASFSMPAACRCHFHFSFIYASFRHFAAATLPISIIFAMPLPPISLLITPLLISLILPRHDYAITPLLPPCFSPACHFMPDTIAAAIAALRHISPLPPLFRFSFFHYA
jgi:hypothetical protein